jgi:fructose-1,6-bisphosphatase/inositol monophosphatase family enzyme
MDPPSENKLNEYVKPVKDSPFVREISVCLRAVLRSGNTIVRRDFDLKAEDKPNEFVGHNSMLTAADTKSHEIIIKLMKKEAPEAWIIAEESKGEKKVLTEANFADVIESGATVFSFDEVDGTSAYAWDTSTWAVHAGCQIGLDHVAGAQYMPAINGGLLVFAVKGGGAWEVSGYYGGPKRLKAAKPLNDDHQKVSWYGPDSRIASNRAQFGKFLDKLTDEMRTPMITGSCGYGLALVARGSTHLLFQPRHFIYDWHQGYPCVLEAGGKMIFFTHDNGKLKFHKKPAIGMYNPARKVAGFLAGEADTAEKWAKILKQLYTK